MKTTLLLTALFSCMLYPAWSKERGSWQPELLEISGEIIDEKGLPLPGASVQVKGRAGGTNTSADGSFRITAHPGEVLVFSYIGYKTKNVTVSEKTLLLNISLEPDISLMEEVVVVGYGTQRKINLTGSVATVDFQKLENTPQSNTLNILSGRVAGLSVIQPGAEPGADDPELYVRGIGTLNDASPLVIIDGVQATLADVGNLTPQEIDNISVLKDASSAAIYGARGANGVILVSTKNPGDGKLRINFDTYHGFQQATYLSKFVESWQWLYMDAEATSGLTPEKEAAIRDLQEGIYSDSAANSDWYDEIFRTAPVSNYHISVSGGNKNISFHGGLGYQNQEGIMLGTKGSRYNFRTN
ncbi:MAG TPA: carboxypeptidase-like regulatory domain-containing protein, partial [Anseongella sp.]|nr:carboxypeptidase-like regulatory domain-containing protein [Anseongella sp.]